MNALDLDGSDWFIGDLGDPWVAALADAMPEGAARRSCAGDLTETWFQGPRAPRTLVLHRTLLTPHDAEVLARYRGSRTPPPRVILCVGPHIRHADLERWSALVDVMVPEATARDTIARHLSGGDARPRPSVPRPRVSVVSDNFELRAVLADVCAAAGYSAEPAHEWSEAAPSGLAVWDVPVLEPDWPRQLARRARLGPVVALMGVPDRELVARARAHGASACLELPWDLADLVSTLDRLSAARAESAHVVPPPPAVLCRPARPVAEPARQSYNDAALPQSPHSELRRGERRGR